MMILIEEKEFWTFDLVEERLIEAMRLWWRSPGGGRWPFAGDAPWQLMTRATRIAEGGFKAGRELQLRMQEEDAEETKRLQHGERSGPLTRDDVARRDETTEWLGWVTADARRVLVLALVQLAVKSTAPAMGNDGRRSRQVDWSRVKVRLGAEVDTKGLYRRYSRSLARIAARLNQAG